MARFADVVLFTPTAGGTTDWTYSAAVQGYNSPALGGMVNNAKYKYRAESLDLSQWEVGEGTYNSGTFVLSRTTVLYNSSGTGTGPGQSGAGTKINFTTVPQVGIVMLREDAIGLDEAITFTAAQKAQARANISAGSFSAHLNNVDQTGIASNTPTKVNFSTLLYDPDGTFSTVQNRWTPPAGKVLINCQIWLAGTFAAGASLNAVVYKNGAQFKGGFFYAPIANDGVTFCNIQDVANGTDYYEIFVSWPMTSGTGTVHGSPQWTWWMGTVI